MLTACRKALTLDSQNHGWRKSLIFDLLKVENLKHEKSERLRIVAYMTAGESHPPVEKTREAYTAKLVYQDTDAKTVGPGSHKFDTLAKFNESNPEGMRLEKNEVIRFAEGIQTRNRRRGSLFDPA